MRISDWSSDVCSSDLLQQIDALAAQSLQRLRELRFTGLAVVRRQLGGEECLRPEFLLGQQPAKHVLGIAVIGRSIDHAGAGLEEPAQYIAQRLLLRAACRSEEHTSELQSLMRT